MQQMEGIQGQLNRINIFWSLNNWSIPNSCSECHAGILQPPTAAMNTMLETSNSNYDNNVEEKDYVFHDASEEEAIDY